ncbi:hypothetical protein GFB49_08890 [Epibacterium sp. SM1979]|uniref:Uncharacterized protein n=1 Tax=Tritonibacter litoralis TaxID=2662264 RepID=A0A843YFW3_9RHOB|nr:hypothetical protein [Tritonibacter litoralis]MQQ08565.1 hypothetical protein [Tritonibacter litoralis]
MSFLLRSTRFCLASIAFILGGLSLTTAPVAAQTVLAKTQTGSIFPKNCKAQPGRSDSCTLVLACMDDGNIFVGTATGWLRGDLSVRSDRGTSCSGSWFIQNTNSNHGQAGFECSDGRAGQAQFSYFDAATSSVWGDGELSDGTPFRAWTGPHLRRFVKNNRLDVTTFCPTLLLGAIN